jgi:hypothetical protein
MCGDEQSGAIATAFSQADYISLIVNVRIIQASGLHLLQIVGGASCFLERWGWNFGESYLLFYGQRFALEYLLHCGTHTIIADNLEVDPFYILLDCH